MREKLDPNVEPQKCYHARKLYYDLGFGRSIREVARQLGISPNTVSRWSKIYEWDERLKDRLVEKKEGPSDILDPNTPIGDKMINLMARMEAVIDSAFNENKLADDLKLQSVEELTKFITEYRRFLETYQRFVAIYEPKRTGTGKEKPPSTKIDQLIMFLGNMPQEERLKAWEALKNGNDPTRDKRSEGGVQEADFTEVSESGS